MLCGSRTTWVMSSVWVGLFVVRGHYSAARLMAEFWSWHRPDNLRLLPVWSLAAERLPGWEIVVLHYSINKYLTPICITGIFLFCSSYSQWSGSPLFIGMQCSLDYRSSKNQTRSPAVARVGRPYCLYLGPASEFRLRKEKDFPLWLQSSTCDGTSNAAISNASNIISNVIFIRASMLQFFTHCQF